MEKFWFSTAGGVFAICGGLIGANAAISHGSGNYSFWIGPLAIAVYAAAAIGVACLICGLYRIRGPRRHHSQFTAEASTNHYRTLGDDVLREIRKLSVAPKLTWAQRQRLLEPYLGMTVRVSGLVVDVGEWARSYSRVEVRTRVRKLIVFMDFSHNDAFHQYLSIVTPGKKFTALGEINRIEPGKIYLSN